MGRRYAVLTCVLLLLPGTATARSEPVPRVEFASAIQPLFKSRCYSCHDGRKHRAGLRLDVRADAMRGGESGKPAIVPARSAASELIRRVNSTKEEEWMPPKGPRLGRDELNLLKTWIDQGASWPDDVARGSPEAGDHWAFQAPVSSELPSVKNASWPRNALDRFVLARLDKEGMKPSPGADRITLIRRLSLDLIGLPPSIAEIDAFLADSDRYAHEHLADRLLNSPHYGERWGRHWLDAARYADSDGFEKDKPRQVWYYRDWVIHALNRDMPYDEFIIEQIAGDLLPHAGQEPIVATGYLRNSMLNEEGGIDPEQFRMEAMFDRMDAIGKGILGLTIQCCQCHSHKYDPLTQIDYYRMFAFLNNCYEANAQVYTPLEQMEKARVLHQIQKIEDDLRHRHPDWRERMHAWEKKSASKLIEWTILRPEVQLETTGGQNYLPIEDGSFLALGYAPTKHTVKLAARTDVKDITAFRLELLTDPNLPLEGPGRSIKGTGALTEFKVEAAPLDAPTKTQGIKIVKATADVNPPARPLEAIFDDRSGKKRITGPVSFAIDGKDETAWGIDVGPGRRNQPRKAVFQAAKPISFPKGTVLTFHLKQDHGGWNSDDNQNCNLGRFRLSVTRHPKAEADPLPDRVRRILAIPPERRTEAEEAAVFSYWRTTVPQWKDATEQIESLWRSYPEGYSQLVLHERDKPRATHVLKRGDFLKPAQAIGPGVPAFLHPLPAGAPLTRLTFARWLTDRRSPTTARALVNRVWQAYFGTGIVATSEDLGTQSEAPSHPELLDWLAVDFMDHGWSLKHLHRLIVTSATYRQSSRISPKQYARDPYNRLLARGPRLRVEAEIVRDIALDASGLLNREIGGRSVFPPLPEFMTQPPVSYGPKIWPEDKGPERYRRGLYTFRYRSVPYPLLQTFDAPNGDAACVRRVRSNTPLQALISLNEPIALECARALAMRILRQGSLSDVDRIVYAFRCCLGRRPTEPEAAELLRLLKSEQGRFARPEAKPLELAADKPAQPQQLPPGASPTDAAAWTVVSRVLLNLDETITKE